MENSKIEWTHHTFNPWIGCAKVSPGCKNCYAEADMDKRRGRVNWGVNGTRSPTSKYYWSKPERWNRVAKAAGERHRVFCASLADVFEDFTGAIVDSDGNLMVDVTLRDFRDQLFRIIEATPHLDWLLLTKRPENVMSMVPDSWQNKFPDNVWMGTSVEDQDAANARIPHLIKIPARIRFLSCEPLLGFVDLTDVQTMAFRGAEIVDALSGTLMDFLHDICPNRLTHTINWVIAGGESGHNARPMHPDWAMSLQKQTEDADVPFLFKQWGEWLPMGQYMSDGSISCLDKHEKPGLFVADGLMAKVGKKQAGRFLDGKEYNQFPS